MERCWAGMCWLSREKVSISLHKDGKRLRSSTHIVLRLVTQLFLKMHASLGKEGYVIYLHL